MSLCLSNSPTGRVQAHPGISPALRELPRIMLARWLEYRRRRTLRKLLDRDHKTLDDIGLQPDEIQWALRLPLDQNALVCLRERATQRRRIEFAMRNHRKPVVGLKQW